MKPTPTPSFPMETNKDIEAYIKRITAPIFKKVLKETDKNHMLVGGMVQNYKFFCYYQPHNYRLYIDFNRTTFNQQKPTPPGLVNNRIINSTEHMFEYENFKIRVKKHQIEVINNKDFKRWYRIELSKAEPQIIKLIRKKTIESINALKRFIKHYGGSSDFHILNSHIEDKIKHEESVDMIPIRQRFHNEVVKKVYNEGNVEFSNPVFTINYLSNRAIENIAPSIAHAMNTINPLRAIKNNMARFIDIYKNKHLIGLLNASERQELEEWIFERFRIGG